MSGLGRRLSRLPGELTALFCVILRQSPRRGCSRTFMYAPPPDGGFSLSDAKISPSANRGAFAFCIQISRSANMGGFRVLHPNIALSELVFKRVHLVPRRDLGGEKSPPKQASAGHKVIKARGGRPLRACFDFNLSSLSRARKFLLALQAKFFGATP